jgi:hypothetical protein
MAKILPPSSANVTESESLILPEPSEPHRPVMGLLYLVFTMKVYGGVSALMLVPKQCKQNTTKREYSECELQHHSVNTYVCLSRHVQKN